LSEPKYFCPFCDSTELEKLEEKIEKQISKMFASVENAGKNKAEGE
jgi:hypothetical protein